MDCLCAIGNGVVGKIAEYTVEPFGRLVGRQVGYLIHYNKNLQNLRTQVKNLSDARDRVEHQVAEADRRGEIIENEVQEWLKEVALIIKDTEELLKGKCQATGEPNEVLKDEGQANEEPNEVLKDERQGKLKRLHQFCPNPRLRYQLSRKSTKLVEAVDELYKRKDFSSVSYSGRAQEVVFPNLTTLSIQKCDHLRFLFSCSMAKSFVQLKHLEISNCRSMEEVVSSTTDYNEENMNNVFCKLETLVLDELPCLGRICTGTRIEFPSLKKLVIRYCIKLKAFICDPMSDKSTRICKEIEERESEESPSVEHESVAERCLFNDKVRFPSLEELKIRGSDELQTIWHNNQLADQDSFCRLKQVYVSYCKSLISIFPPSIMGRLNALERLVIDTCNSLKVVFEVGGINVEETRVNRSTPYDQWKPLYCQNLEFLRIWDADSLKNIFPASLARGLQQLRTLSVGYCRDLLEIVGEEEGGVELPTPPQFVFPKATYVSFYELPQLKSFYPGKHTSTWPLLKELTVRLKSGINEVKISIFQDKHESGPVKSIFPIDKDSFPNLEELTVDNMDIWYGTSPVPTESFSNLKYIEFYNWAPFSQQATSLFLQKLHNIERIEVNWAPPEEIFVSEGNSSCEEIHAVGTLPSIRILMFDGCKMLHLGKENSGSGGPIFPNLEVLEVRDHSLGLKNLESSAISFRNLTTLKVVYCRGLEHLITYSVAKSLMQLTTMEVSECPRIAVIVTTDGDDAAEEITFSQLQVLTLRGLPKMQGFCSGSCIVNLPSSTTLSMSNRLKLKIFQEKLKITSKYPDTEEEKEDNVDEEIGVPSAETNIAS